MSVALGSIVTDSEANTWRVWESLPGRGGGGGTVYLVKRRDADNQSIAKQMPESAFATIDPPPDYAVGASVTVGGIPGEVMEKRTGAHGDAFRVQLARDPQPFTSQPVDQRWVHSFAMDS